MIKRLIGAAVGRQAAKHTEAVGGTGGAILGALAVSLIARLSIPTMLAVTAGGYISKRLYDKRQAQQLGSATAANTDTFTKTNA